MVTTDTRTCKHCGKPHNKHWTLGNYGEDWCESGFGTQEKPTTRFEPMPGNYNYEMCSACKGRCCKHMAGIYHPDDLKSEGSITVELITTLLDTGKFSIDWWEGDIEEKELRSRTYYLRPRHKDANAIDGSWGGTCINWSESKGCALPETKRPYVCRMLMPERKNDKYTCHIPHKDKGDKKTIVRSWLPYQDILGQVADEYYNRN